MAIAVPGLPSVLLHGAGVRPSSLPKPRLGHAPTVNVYRRLSFPPIPVPQLGCCNVSQANGALSLVTQIASSVPLSLTVATSFRGKKIILCFARRETCASSDPNGEDSEAARLTAFHNSRDWIGNVGEHAFFWSWRRCSTLHPYPSALVPSTRQSLGDVG